MATAFDNINLIASADKLRFGILYVNRLETNISHFKELRSYMYKNMSALASIGAHPQMQGAIVS